MSAFVSSIHRKEISYQVLVDSIGEYESICFHSEIAQATRRGTRFWPAWEAISLMKSLRQADIQFIFSHHESITGYMAGTTGLLTGVSGLCIPTRDFGLPGMKATSREEFRQAFRQALDSGRGVVIEVATCYDEYLRYQ